jgi:hypothetical protein
MQTPTQTPKQVAETLYAMMPHALSRGTLEEYGIEARPHQAAQITKEVLSLNLFWIESALEAHLTTLGRERVLQELHQLITSSWAKDFSLEGSHLENCTAESKARQHAYAAIVQEGGSPISVFTETAAYLDSNGAVQSDDQKKVLALLIDVVPVDSYGEVVEDIELREG